MTNTLCGASLISTLLLQDPGNWTTLHSSSLLFSKEGNAYTAIAVLQPALTESGKGTPAGLRSHQDYQKNPTNFMTSMQYILNDNGEVINPQLSFRGGQFPTIEAARQGIELMMKNSEGKLDNLHINALLTPTVFHCF